MAISGINSYRDTLYQWQGQQLKNTGNSAANSATSTALSTLFGGSASMTSQINSMVELTKYAMDQMGLSSDARVTFSQISRYREQLQSEFNEGVKKGLAESGVSDLNALSFELDKNGKINVVGENAKDRKTAQAWLDANPSYGEKLLKELPEDAFEDQKIISFNISSTGKLTVENETEQALQEQLDKQADLADKTREELKKAGIALPLELKFDAEGNLIASDTMENAEEVNAWLRENTELATAIQKELKKQDVDPSAVSLRLGEKGAPQVTVNNASLKDIQAAFDKNQETGAKIMAGLSDLGIDKNISFAIQVNDDGSITVISDHPDAAKMQKFFDENPDLVKKYKQIEALTGIDDARKSMQISPSAMRKRIQIESMSAWWSSSGSASSYFGNYSTEGLSLMAGLNMRA